MRACAGCGGPRAAEREAALIECGCRGAAAGVEDGVLEVADLWVGGEQSRRSGYDSVLRRAGW